MQTCMRRLFRKGPQRINKTTKLPGKVIAILIFVLGFILVIVVILKKKRPSMRFFQLFHFMTYFGRTPPLSGFLNDILLAVMNFSFDYFNAFVNACGKSSPGTCTSTRPL